MGRGMPIASFIGMSGALHFLAGDGDVVALTPAEAAARAARLAERHPSFALHWPTGAVDVTRRVLGDLRAEVAGAVLRRRS